MLNKVNLDRPICFLDIETTGLNKKDDRIVEIYIKKIHPDKKTIEEYHQLVNPGQVEISEEAFAIHGLTKQILKNNPTFNKIAKDIEFFIGDCHIGGWNVMSFDLPFVMNEFYRCGIIFNYKKNNRKVIDAQNIYKSSLSPSGLAFAHQYLLGEAVEDVRSTKNDVNAAIRVLEANIDLVNMFDMDELDGLSKFDNYFDLSGKVLHKENKFILNFGKYYGKSVFDMFNLDDGYYKWLMNSDTTPIDTKYVLKILYTYWMKNK